MPGAWYNQPSPPFLLMGGSLQQCFFLRHGLLSAALSFKCLPFVLIISILQEFLNRLRRLTASHKAKPLAANYVLRCKFVKEYFLLERSRRQKRTSGMALRMTAPGCCRHEVHFAECCHSTFLIVALLHNLVYVQVYVSCAGKDQVTDPWRAVD